jgi:hypothetical protein
VSVTSAEYESAVAAAPTRYPTATLVALPVATVKSMLPAAAAATRPVPATPVRFVKLVALSGLTVGTNRTSLRTVCEPEPVAPAPVPPLTQGQAMGVLAVTGAQAFGQTTLGQSLGNTVSGISNMFSGGQQNKPQSNQEVESTVVLGPKYTSGTDFKERTGLDKNMSPMAQAAYLFWNAKANGGSILKPMGTDTVPTMLTPGEFVMKKSAVDQIGVNNLSQMNNSKSYFAGGGFVGNSANLDQSASFNQAAAGFDGFAASFNTSVTNFNASVETFGAKVAEFASAVATMPATLTVNGEVGANVTTNSAGIINQISNAVQSMIASQVVKSLPTPSMDQASKPS